jgi:hypothetical protein
MPATAKVAIQLMVGQYLDFLFEEETYSHQAVAQPIGA